MHRSPTTRMLIVVGTILASVAAHRFGVALAAPADEDHYRLGLSFLQRGMHDLAAKELHAYLDANEKAENAPTARYALASCLRQAKDFDRAVRELDTALAGGRFEFEPDARLLRAQCLFELARYPDVVRACDEFAANHSAHALADRALLLRAESLYRLGKYDEAAAAVADGKALLGKSALAPRARLIESMSQLAAGSYAKGAASAALLRREDSPFTARATLVEAQCRRRLGESEAAIALLEEAARASDASVAAEARLGWAGVLREMGQPRQALRVLEGASGAVLATQPDAFALERARALFDEKEFDQSLHALSSHVEANSASGQAEATHLAARCEMALGTPQSAIERFESLAARAKHPLRADVLLDWGLAEAQNHRYARAASILRDLLERSPEPDLAAEALVALAQCQHNLSQPKDALGLCDTFLSHYGTHASVATIRLLRAQCLDQLDDTSSAAAAYDEFLSRHASDSRAPSAQVARGLMLMRSSPAEAGAAVLTVAIQNQGLSLADRVACLSALANSAIAISDWSTARQWLEQLRPLSNDEARTRELTYRIGLCLAHQGEHAAAIEEFSHVALSEPDSTLSRQASLEQGKSLIAVDRLDDARACLTRLVSDDASNSISREALGVLSEIASRQGRTQEAIDLLHASADPTKGTSPTAAVRLREGSLLLAAARYDDAERALRSLVDAPDIPTSIKAEARARLAICTARQGRHDKAEPELRAALAEAPLDAELARAVQFELARTCAALGRTPEAETVFAMVAESAPSVLGAMSCLELARIELNATPETAEHATVALSQLDTCARYARVLSGIPSEISEQESYLRGVCLSRLGRAEVIPTLTAFLEKYPKSPLASAAQLLLGQALGQHAEWTRAASHFESAVALATDNDIRARATLLMGNALSESQQWSKAEATFLEYLKAHASSELWFQAQFGVGWARENAGQHEKAIEAFRGVTSRHQGPTAARAQFQIGECLFALSRHEDAVREFGKVEALHAYPEWAAASLYESGRCLQEMGRTDDAHRAMSDVIAKYGDTKWASLAREHLSRMAAKPKAGRGSAPSEPAPTTQPPKANIRERR